jgi:hypothetical protein
MLLNTLEKEPDLRQEHFKLTGKEIISLRTSCMIMMVLSLVMYPICLLRSCKDSSLLN